MQLVAPAAAKASCRVLGNRLLLDAGYGETVPGFQLNRYCTSGLDTVNQAAAAVASARALPLPRLELAGTNGCADGLYHLPAPA